MNTSFNGYDISTQHIHRVSNSGTALDVLVDNE